MTAIAPQLLISNNSKNRLRSEHIWSEEELSRTLTLVNLVRVAKSMASLLTDVPGVLRHEAQACQSRLFRAFQNVSYGGGVGIQELAFSILTGDRLGVPNSIIDSCALTLADHFVCQRLNSDQVASSSPAGTLSPAGIVARSGLSGWATSNGTASANDSPNSTTASARSNRGETRISRTPARHRHIL
jgi:hypothetical protein